MSVCINERGTYDVRLRYGDSTAYFGAFPTRDEAQKTHDEVKKLRDKGCSKQHALAKHSISKPKKATHKNIYKLHTGWQFKKHVQGTTLTRYAKSLAEAKQVKRFVTHQIKHNVPISMIQKQLTLGLHVFEDGCKPECVTKTNNGTYRLEPVINRKRVVIGEFVSLPELAAAYTGYVKTMRAMDRTFKPKTDPKCRISVSLSTTNNK